MSVTPATTGDPTGPPTGARLAAYLHGLNGSSRSLKAGVLRAALAPLPLLVPDYPAHRPAAAVAVLTAALSAALAAAGAGARLVLIGSSMGGFYGQYLARRLPTAHLFLINPALNAPALWAELNRQTPHGTMVSGTGEPYRLLPADLAALTPWVIDDPGPCPVPTTVLLDEGDELIDWRIAATRYRGHGRVLHFPGGDHAFAHLPESLPLIRAALDGTG